MNIDKTVDEINEALTEKVKKYNRLRQDGKSSFLEVETLYSEIEEKLEIISYYLPQKYFRMDEEDASEFLLYVVPWFRRIVEKFIGDSNDFCGYFYCVLKRKIKAFNSGKATACNRENLILNSYEVRENYVTYSCTNKYVPKISGSDSMLRLKYSLKYSNTLRRRFFIYFLSLCPFIETGVIEELCSFAKINLEQMITLSKYVSTKTVDLISEKNNLIEKRNLYFARSLELEKELEILKSCNLDYRKTENFLLILNNRIERKNEQIENLASHVPYPVIADLLNINTSTVSTQVYYMKKFISWCCKENFDIESNVYEFAIGSSLMKDLIFGRWKYDKIDSNFKEFFPIREFKISNPDIITDNKTV